jgi:hypothetical protein
MHHKLFFVILAALCIAAAPASAQDDAPKGQLLSIHEDVIIPSTMEKYEKAAKNLAELITKSGVGSVSYTAARMDNFTYIYFAPVENMAALDKLGESWGEVEKKVGKQNFDAAMKQFDGCYPSHKNYLIRLRPELSYNPEYGRGIVEGLLFRHWDFYYIHPGMESEADNIAKEWVALNKKMGGQEGYRLYSSSYGSDGPLFIVVQSAKDALDFYTRQEAWLKKAGDEGKALWAKTWKVVRKFDTMTGMIRPDLSVQPKETTKK